MINHAVVANKAVWLRARFSALMLMMALIVSQTLTACSGSESTDQGGESGSAGGSGGERAIAVEQTKNLSAAETVETAAKAIASGQPATIWEMFPASYQKDIETVIADFANGMDPEVWNKGLAILGKAHTLISTKADLLLQSAQGMIPAQPGMGPEQMKDSLAKAADAVKQLLDSKILELENLKKPDIRKWIQDSGQQAAQDLVQLIKDGKLAQGAEAQEMIDNLNKLNSVTAKIVNEADGVATVEVTTGENVESVEFVKVDDRWIPKDMSEQFPQAIQQAKAALATMPQTMQQAKPQALMMMGMVEGMLDSMNNANSAQEMQQAVFAVMGMMGGMAMGGGMGAPGMPPDMGAPPMPDMNMPADMGAPPMPPDMNMPPDMGTMPPPPADTPVEP